MTRGRVAPKAASKATAAPKTRPKQSVQARAARRLSNAPTVARLASGGAPMLRARVSRARIEGLDAARGLALVAMIAYHFAFDLRYFGFTHSDFEHDPVWLAARSGILGSFLLIAGISLALASRRPNSGPRFVRHVAIIGAAALAVTAGSALLFPQSFIWFGVLHAIALSLILARPLVERPMIAAIVGIIVIVAGIAFSHPAFDTRALGWLGFMTGKPTTEDYVPLFPWTGVLFAGVASASWLSRTDFRALSSLARAPRWVHWMGRHSLAIYLIHQPVLMGALWTATRLLRGA